MQVDYKRKQPGQSKFLKAIQFYMAFSIFYKWVKGLARLSFSVQFNFHFCFLLFQQAFLLCGWSGVCNCVATNTETPKPRPPTHTHAENKRSYQKQSDQLAAPPGRIQRQEEQRSKKKGEQKQMGFHDRYEITDHNPAENPPQWENLRQRPEKERVWESKTVSARSRKRYIVLL